MRLRATILWLAFIAVLILFGACLLRGAVPLPPAGKKIVKRVKPPTQGSGAELLMARAPVAPPAPNVKLTWDWDADTNNPASNIVFVVRRLTTNQYARPSTNWPIVAIVRSKSYTQAVDRTVRVAWFGVTASNQLTRLESGFARR